MIVKMKKITLFMLDSLKELQLKALKELGALHITPVEGSGETLAELNEELKKKRELIAVLPTADVADADDISEDAAEELFSAIEELVFKKQEAEENLLELRSMQSTLEPLGEFNIADLKELEESGWVLSFFHSTKKQFESLPEDLETVVLTRDKKEVLFAVLGHEVPELEIKPIVLPEKGLQQVRKEIVHCEEVLTSIRSELEDIAGQKHALDKIVSRIEEASEFENIRTGLPSDEDIVFFTGYIPVDKVESLKGLAKQEGFGLAISDPVEEDSVPTLVKQRGPVKIVKPVFDLMGTLPGYRESDISLMFLIAFGFFVAMIVGDAAYGFVMLLGTILLQIKSKKKPGIVFGLFVYLSITTIIWGTITGTWFGSEYLSNLPFLRQFVIEPIASYSRLGADVAIKNVMMLTFVTGLIHLSLARIESFIRKLPALNAFEELGWLITLQGLFVLVLDLVIQVKEPFGLTIPSWFLMTSIITGLGLVILFGKQEGKVFKGALIGIAFSPLTFLDAVSAFSDIISYVRLFAVGLASVAVAESFNLMASGANPVVAALIMFGGHSLNLVMAFMSIAVHGLRLNMLEYSGHMGLEWSGFEYKPFSKRS